MKANKTRKNKKQSGGFQFLTDMFNKGKKGWNDGTKSIANSSKNMFSPKPKPAATTSTTYTTAPKPVYNQTPTPVNNQTPTPVNNQTYGPVNNQTNVPTYVPSYSDPMTPTSITTGGRKRQRRRRKSQKKKYSRTKRGGYDLNDSAPVSGLKVASPTYWIGGRKSKRRRRKSRRYR